ISNNTNPNGILKYGIMQTMSIKAVYKMIVRDSVFSSKSCDSLEYLPHFLLFKLKSGWYFHVNF
ncbi:MAG TPA: hypothetical protein PJ990_07820, partial [Saprospiraceae bacterium]|nr:hypothetical protein [Saprospiraceae bacterium]